MSAEQRYELKFVAPAELYPHMRHWLLMHELAFHTGYPARQINNIYWDSNDFDSFQDHVLGSIERVKLRYRWYGQGWTSADSRLELKAKHGLITDKQTYPLSLVLGPALRWQTVFAQMLQALAPPIRLWLLRRTQAVLLSHYQREYFVSSSGIRVTLDRNICSFDQRYRADVNLLKRCLTADVLVLEVKCAPDQYADAQILLKAMPIRGERYSKYMMGVRAAVAF